MNQKNYIVYILPTCNPVPVECVLMFVQFLPITSIRGLSHGISFRRLLSAAITLPLILHHGQQNHLAKWIQLSKYQEDINHLDIGCGRQHLHDSHEDGGHDQHGG